MEPFDEYLEEIKRIAAEEGYDSLDETYVEHLRTRFFGNDVVIGESKRVRLREMKLSDLDTFYTFLEMSGRQERILGHGEMLPELEKTGKFSEVSRRESELTEDLEKILPDVTAATADESVLSAFIKETRADSESHLQAYISNMYPLYDYGIWAVELKKTGKVIGLCGLGLTELDGAECTDLGYYICPKCRNLGLATECVEIVLDYAKNYLEFSVIYAIIKEENRISKGVLRKFGFTPVKQYEDAGQKQEVYKKSLAEWRRE